MTELKSTWICPSNIALVKYWGKKPPQRPMNPSLSFSLQNAKTQTSISLIPRENTRLTFLFEQKPSPFAVRMEKYLDSLSSELPWINDYSFYIESENTFPHSAGIASSASSFGALALCLADLNDQICRTGTKPEQFIQTASRLARLGSGSACRSVYPGFAWWGKSAALKGSSDDFALSVSEQIHPGFHHLCDAILLVDSSPKSVSSSAGHQLMNMHPYQSCRINQANQNIENLLFAMKTDNRNLFIEIVETEALSLHALMMSSTPSFMLLKPKSLQIIEKIRDFRKQSKLPVGFTIDAGPNIHLLYWLEHQNTVQKFIQQELAPLLENGKWLNDQVGNGPSKI